MGFLPSGPAERRIQAITTNRTWGEIKRGIITSNMLLEEVLKAPSKMKPKQLWGRVTPASKTEHRFHAVCGPTAAVACKRVSRFDPLPCLK